MKTVHINNIPIGKGHPPFIVAELSANHCRDLKKALKLIDAAKKAGADAVKLQTYLPDTITLDSDRPEFKITKGRNAGLTLYQLYEQGSTPWEWHKELFDYAKSIGITIFSSPFDLSAVDFLETLNCSAYKIASFELVDIPLIKKVASTQKPIIMSTGMANLDEINQAIATVKNEGNDNVIILHCVSSYPTPVEETNLKTITDLVDRGIALVGLSDHTLGIATSIASVALGACFIEKHFTLKRDDKSLDSEFSLEPHEFENMVENANYAWKALGDAQYDLKQCETYSYRLRRSLYAVEDIETGEQLTPDNVRSVRPNNGLHPKYYDSVLKMKAKNKIEKHTPLSWDLLAD